MATRTIANGGGNYNSTGTWVEGAVPTASDDVVATGTSGQLTITAAAAARSVDLTNYTNTLTHNSGITWTIGTSTAQASLIALNFPSSGWTYAPAANSSQISFVSTVASTTQTVNLGGIPMANLFFSSATTSGYQLTGAVAYKTSLSPTFNHSQGTLSLNGQTFTFYNFTSNSGNTRTLDMTSTTVNMILAWTVTSTGLTLTSTGSLISYALTTLSPTFAGGGMTYNNLTVTGSSTNNLTFTISGANTFNNLSVTQSNNSFFITLKPTSGTTNTVTGTLTLTGGGSTGNIRFFATTTGSRATISLSNSASTTYVNFNDIVIIGAGMPLNATGTGNINNGDNSGIQFNALYDIIQQTTVGSGLASTATSLTLSTTTGNTLIAVITENQTGNTWTVSDTATGNNTWTQAITKTNTNQRVDIWYAKNITGNAAEALVVTSTGVTSDVAVVLYEAIGLDLSTPVDKTATAATTGTAPTTASSGTLSQADEIVIVGLISADTTVAHITAGTGYFQTPITTEISTVYSVAAEYKTVAATTAITGAFKDTTSAAYAIAAATFIYTSSSANKGAMFLQIMGA